MSERLREGGMRGGESKRKRKRDEREMRGGKSERKRER